MAGPGGLCLPNCLTASLSAAVSPRRCDMRCARLRQVSKPTPCPADDMICWSESVRIDNVKGNDPSLMEPIAAVG